MAIKFVEGKRPVFIGAGHTVCRRYMGRTKSSLANEAALMAIADAGLQVSDIDGMYCWANPNWGPSVQGDPAVWLDIAHMMSVVPWDNIKHWWQGEAVAASSRPSTGTASVVLDSR